MSARHWGPHQDNGPVPKNLGGEILFIRYWIVDVAP
jgi:hypothetical protein